MAGGGCTATGVAAVIITAGVLAAVRASAAGVSPATVWVEPVTVCRGDICALDRAKFFNLHGGVSGWDARSDVSSGSAWAHQRNAHIGRSFAVSGLYSTLKQTATGAVDVAAVADFCNAHSIGRNSSILATGWPIDHVEFITSSKTELYYPALGQRGFVASSHAVAADAWSAFLHNCAPEWQPRWICELANEPNVKVKEANTTWDDMVQLHVAIANRIHSDFGRHGRAVVAGPTEAFPEYESKDFSHWHNVTKYFIDVAGSQMDALSVHIYDTMGSAEDGPNGSSNCSFRSGNNLDAVLDLPEAYTAALFGKPLPHLISEFGTGFKVTPTEYQPVHDWYVLRGVTSKIMQLLHRPHTVLKAVPFITMDSSWYKGPGFYPFDSWHQQNGTEIATHLQKFYTAWANVAGTYLLCNSTDAQVQVVAFRDIDGTLHIALNNLQPTEAPLIFDGSLANLAGASVNFTRLYFDSSAGVPVLQSLTGKLSANLVLAGEELLLMRVLPTSRVDAQFTARTKLLESTRYSDATVTPISAAGVLNFAVRGPPLSTQAVYIMARISFSLPNIGALTAPQVTVAGVKCPVVLQQHMAGHVHTDAHTGELFGSISVPVPAAGIAAVTFANSSTDVTVQFPTAGGYISSVVLIVGEQA